MAPMKRRPWYRIVPATSKIVKRNDRVQFARSQLLRTIETVAPKVLSTLHEQPYRLYRALPAQGTDEGAPSWADLGRPETKVHTDLRESLRDWGTRWNLDADWIYNAALDAMDSWTTGGRPSSWGRRRIIVGPTVPPTIPFALDNWQVLRGETRRAFERRARKNFREFLTRHCADVESAFLPAERRRLHATHPDRFVWTIRWVVCREPALQIAKSHPHLKEDGSAVRSDRKTVADSVQNSIDTVLAQADFKPKRLPRGRPRRGSSISCR